MANGERIPSAGVCTATTITIGDERFTIDIYIIPLGGYELILGCQWLRTLGPIIWDFEVKSMAFWRTDHRVKWYGVGADPVPRLAAMAARDLMSLLLEEFKGVFVETNKLPPPRHLDLVFT